MIAATRTYRGSVAVTAATLSNTTAPISTVAVSASVSSPSMAMCRMRRSSALIAVSDALGTRPDCTCDDREAGDAVHGSSGSTRDTTIGVMRGGRGRCVRIASRRSVGQCGAKSASGASTARTTRRDVSDSRVSSSAAGRCVASAASTVSGCVAVTSATASRIDAVRCGSAKCSGRLVSLRRCRDMSVHRVSGSEHGRTHCSNTALSDSPCKRLTNQTTLRSTRSRCIQPLRLHRCHN